MHFGDDGVAESNSNVNTSGNDETMDIKVIFAISFAIANRFEFIFDIFERNLQQLLLLLFWLSLV